MTATLYGKQRDWSLDRDDEGHRTYKITWLVLADLLDGPYVVLNCPQLPAEGSGWFFDNDADEWAWCRPECSVRRYAAQPGAAHRWWTVEQTFSTKPPTKQRCQDNAIEDPILEPARISGGGVKYTEEATFDRWGQPLLNSAHEMFRGPQVEFDANRNTVKIEQNVATWDQVVAAINASDTVNSLPIWGAPVRCVKLSNVAWDRQFFQKCVIYFKRTLTFDIFIKEDPDTGEPISGFDKDLVDAGTKALRGQFNSAGQYVLQPWPDYTGTPNPDPANPLHFVRFRDARNEACEVLLNGAGLPSRVSVVGTNLFVSLQNANTGNPTDDSGFWEPVVGPNTPPVWVNTESYTPGNLVDSAGLVWLCKVSNTNVAPSAVLPGSLYWTFLGSVTNRGLYNAGTTYALGDLVTDMTQDEPGKHHVEKYLETDMTTLGIPVDFTVP